MREPLILSAAMMLLAYAARADGLAEAIMQPNDCWSRIFDRSAFAEIIVIEEADLDAQFAAYLDPCGPKPAWTDALARHAFIAPEPLPSPVPLGGSAGYLIAAVAVMALGGRKWKLTSKS